MNVQGNSNPVYLGAHRIQATSSTPAANETSLAESPNKASDEEIMSATRQKLAEADTILGDTTLSNNEKKDKLAAIGVHPSQDLGGHGGTYRVEIKIPGKQPEFLFLKKYDPVEHNNYKIINSKSDKLSEFMPKIYDKISWGDNDFLVMANTRVTAEGKSLKQIADIKLSGKTHKHGIIAEQAEVRQTRNREKSALTIGQQELGAKLAPNYMVAKGNRYARIFGYYFSKAFLKNDIAKDHCTKPELEALKEKMIELKNVLKDADIAPIGSSITFVHNKEANTIELKLIDPAHMQINPNLRHKPDVVNNKSVLDLLSSSYEGKTPLLKRTQNLEKPEQETEFEERRGANLAALDAIIETIDEAIGEAPLTRVEKEDVTNATPTRKLSASQRLSDAIDNTKDALMAAVFKRFSGLIPQ